MCLNFICLNLNEMLYFFYFKIEIVGIYQSKKIYRYVSKSFKF